MSYPPQQPQYGAYAPQAHPQQPQQPQQQQFYPPQHQPQQQFQQHPHPSYPAAPAPSPSPPPSVPYIGARISLLSNLNIRYEGVLYTIDPKESTVALQHVRCFGTEDRPAERFVPASAEVYEFVLFGGRDIKDLSVLAPQQPHHQQPPQDPAILSAAAPPAVQQPAEQPQQQQQPQQPEPHAQPQQQQGGQRGGRQGPHTVRIINDEPRRAAPAPAPALPVEDLTAPFDFQSANARFEKIEDAAGAAAAASGSSVPSYELPGAEDGAALPVVAKKYDKSKSFFDDLTSDRSAEQFVQRRDMRRVDVDTFGADAQQYRSKHGRRGGRGGRGRQQGQQQGQWRQQQN